MRRLPLYILCGPLFLLSLVCTVLVVVSAVTQGFLHLLFQKLFNNE